MADEKKIGETEQNETVTEALNEKAEKSAKAAKTVKTDKKKSKFSFKIIGAAIKRFFKDQKGEVKKIVWPGPRMVIKSTGVVLASIIIIGAGIWIVDFALSGGVSAVNKAAVSYSEKAAEEATATTTEAVSEDATDDTTAAADATTDATTEVTTESTTAAE